MFFIGYYYPHHQIKWKRIRWFDGEKTKYSVANIGVIRNDKTGRILKTSIRPDGYERVRLTHNGKSREFFVHRVVAMAFIKNPKNKLEVNHINGVKEDNYDVNLEWVTRKENQRHAAENGLIHGIGGAKPRISDKKLEQIYEYLCENKKTIKKIAQLTGVSRTTVSHIKDKKYGFVDGKVYDFSNYESKPVYSEFGELNRKSKYKNEQIIKVCELIDSGKYSLREVEEKSGLPYQTIRNIYYGTCWSQISKNYNFYKNKTRVLDEREKLVEQICDLLDQGYNTREVSEKLNVGRSMVRCIYSGQSWSNLTKDRQFMKNKTKR